MIIISKNSSPFRFLNRLMKFSWLTLVLILMCSISDSKDFHSIELRESIRFQVRHKKKTVGFIQLDKYSDLHNEEYRLRFEAKSKVIFSVHAIGIERSEYRTDTLVYSSMYRRVNNRVKLNIELRYQDGSYVRTDGDKKELLKVHLIRNNLTSLLVDEPIGITSVYSEKYKRMIPVYKIKEGQYKITLPNNSSNTYTYENGKCIHVKAKSNFFKIEFVREDASTII